MAFAWQVRRHPGSADFCIVSTRSFGIADVCGGRLRVLCLSAGVFSARVFLARRDAAVESLQQLRRAVPGAMEYHAALSAGPDLPSPASALVAQSFLSVAPV